MFPFKENKTITAIDLTHMMNKRPTAIKQIMEAVLALVEDRRIAILSIYMSSTTRRSKKPFDISKEGRMLVEPY